MPSPKGIKEIQKTSYSNDKRIDLLLSMEVSSVEHSVIRKNGKNIVINPTTGNWGIMDNRSYNIFSKMKNTALSAIHDEFRVEPPELSGFVQELYRYGLVSIDGNLKFQTNNSDEDLSFSLLVLKLTNKCNLSCKYCYNEGLDVAEGAIPLEIACRSINSGFEACKKAFTIVLHGGEPLLQFQEVKQIVEYAEKRAKELSKKVYFSMQTNATVLTHENIQFIKEHDIGLGVSLDGPELLNDQGRLWNNGKGSFSQILRGINLLKEHGLSVNIITVVTKYNARRLSEIVSYFQDLAFRSVKFSYFFPQGMGTSFKDLSPSPEDIVYSLKDIIRKIRMNEISTIEVDDIMSPIDNILMHNKASMCHRSPCGAGKDMLTVFPSGKIYACDCLVHPDFELGNIKDSSFMESRKSEKLIVLDNRTVEQILPCSTCLVKRICGGSMTCRAFWNHGTVNTVDSSECFVNQSIIEELMWALTESETLVNYYKKFKQAVVIKPVSYS